MGGRRRLPPAKALVRAAAPPGAMRGPAAGARVCLGRISGILLTASSVRRCALRAMPSHDEHIPAGLDRNQGAVGLWCADGGSAMDGGSAGEALLSAAAETVPGPCATGGSPGWR